MSQFVVHPASAMAVRTLPAITFHLRSSSLVHARGRGSGSGFSKGLFGFAIGGPCVMGLASTLTSKISKHNIMTVDVAIVFFSLLSLELRRLGIKFFLKFSFSFYRGGGDFFYAST